jgi:hypothetical protein
MLARIELAEGPVPPASSSVARLAPDRRALYPRWAETAEAREARGFRAVAMGEGFYEVVR